MFFIDLGVRVQSMKTKISCKNEFFFPSVNVDSLQLQVKT